MDEIEEDCEKIRRDNERVLDEFCAWLKSSNLSESTIQNHRSNIDFYINEYLLYTDGTQAKDGSNAVGMFLGYWFIKKAMWATKASIKSNATSLAKFYSFMHEKGLIDKKALTDLKQTIKKDLPEWLATLERYDDLEVEDVW